MKRIMFAMIASALMFAGCSADKSPDTSDEADNSSVASENTEPAVTDIPSETSAPENIESTAEHSEKTSVYVSGTKKTDVSEGELPVIKAEISDIATSAVRNTSMTTETKTQTTASEKENGGVIELPIIPVK